MVWVNLSFLTSKINSDHEQNLGRQINHFLIEAGAKCKLLLANISFESKQSTKKSTNYGQVHHDAVHIKQGEKIIITHSGKVWPNVINHI